MKSLNETIADNAATSESKKYMRKFVLETPNWGEPSDVIALAQNQLKMTYLEFDSKDKKFLVTINVEEV